MYSDIDWLIFGEVVQNGKSYAQVSEENNIPVAQVKSTICKWKNEQPELFPSDTERHHMSNKTGTKYRHDIQDYNTLNEKKIIKKF